MCQDNFSESIVSDDDEDGVDEAVDWCGPDVWVAAGLSQLDYDKLSLKQRYNGVSWSSDKARMCRMVLCIWALSAPKIKSWQLNHLASNSSLCFSVFDKQLFFGLNRLFHLWLKMNIACIAMCLFPITRKKKNRKRVMSVEIVASNDGCCVSFAVKEARKVVELHASGL